MVDQFVFHNAVPFERSPVLGIDFSPLTRDKLIQRLLHDPVPQGAGARLLVTANLDHISNLVRNARFRAAYAEAWVATADGMPVYLYAKSRGAVLQERVTGADLTTALLDAMQPGCRPFLIVGRRQTGEHIRDRLVARGFDPEAVGIASPDFGFEKSRVASAELAEAIRAHGSSLLFVGLGAPKSEIWIHENRHLLGDTYALAIGASLDFYAGARTRAPRWMCETGLEWSWRLFCEPRRLFRRYVIESWYVLWAIFGDLFALNMPGPVQRPVRREG